MINRRLWCQGAAATVGLSSPLLAAAADEWVVAQIGPFTGIPVKDASQLYEGAQACFAQINARGGIGGRRIRFFSLDDGYTTDGFAQRFREAVQQKAVALLSPVGSILIKHMLTEKLLDQTDLLVLNAVPGAESFREPGHPQLMHVRAGDRQQIEKVFAHVKTVGQVRVTVLHQNIPTGISGLAMAKAAAERAGVTIEAVEASEEPASLKAGAAKVRGLNSQATLVLGAPWFMANGIAQLRSAGVTHSLFALSYASPTLVNKATEQNGRGVALVQTFPNATGIVLPLQRDFQAAMLSAHPKITEYAQFHLEGYVVARVFAEAARRAASPSGPALAKALRAAGPLDIGGFAVDFSRGNTGGTYVDIGILDSRGRLKY